MPYVFTPDEAKRLAEAINNPNSDSRLAARQKFQHRYGVSIAGESASGSQAESYPNKKHAPQKARFSPLGWWRKSEHELESRLKQKLAQISLDNHRHGGPLLGQAVRVTLVSKAKITARELVRHSKLKSQTRRARHCLELFSDQAVSRCAAIFSFRFEDYPKGGYPCLEAEIERRARGVRRFRKTIEYYRCKERLKDDGSTRRTFAFGPIRHAQQKLLSWVLEAQGAYLIDDYALSGRGNCHGLMRSIGSHLQFDGFRFWAVCDVKSAYSSVTPGMAKQATCLPKEVLRNVAFLKIADQGSSLGDPYYSRDSRVTQEIVPQCELPQGSAHASLLWSAVMKNVLRHLPKSVDTVEFVLADNILIGARTYEGAKEALSNIEKALKVFSETSGCRSGGLILHEKAVCDGYQRPRHVPKLLKRLRKNITTPGIQAPGYSLYKHQWGEGVKYSMSSKSWRRFWKRAREAASEIDSDDEIVQLRTVKRVYTRWFPSFPLVKLNRVGDWPRQRRKLFLTSALVRISDWSEEIDRPIVEARSKTWRSHLAGFCERVTKSAKRFWFRAFAVVHFVRHRGSHEAPF